jgi:hypothetical protein
MSGQEKAGLPNILVIFRQPGCLKETLWAFRPTLASGLVLSSIVNLLEEANKKAGLPNIIVIFRQPGCLDETL